MTLQLRIYTINRGALQPFAEEWKQTIKPLREKIGFAIPAAWAVPATNQFIWLLQYDGSQSWATLDKAFLDHPERRAMDPDPARHIARMENVFIEKVV